MDRRQRQMCIRDRRIEFDRTKLRGSMNLALRKRPVSTEQIDSAIERIEEKFSRLGAAIERVKA